MKKYTNSTYGDRIADIYDQWYSEYERSTIQKTDEGVLENFGSHAKRAATFWTLGIHL